MNVDGNIASGKASTKAPPRAGEDLREFEYRWGGCNTDGDRRDVLRDALETLWAYKMPNPDIRKKRGTREWREAIGREPRTVRQVARMYAVSHTTVLECRREFTVASERPSSVTR